MSKFCQLSWNSHPRLTACQKVEQSSHPNIVTQISHNSDTHFTWACLVSVDLIHWFQVNKAAFIELSQKMIDTTFNLLGTHLINCVRQTCWKGLVINLASVPWSSANKSTFQLNKKSYCRTRNFAILLARYENSHLSCLELLTPPNQNKLNSGTYLCSQYSGVLHPPPPSPRLSLMFSIVDSQPDFASLTI